MWFDLGAGSLSSRSRFGHGVLGTGEASVAGALPPHPADLSHLRQRYGEQHALHQTIAEVDGRLPVRAHGDSAMLVWEEGIEREMNDQKIWWPQATAIQRERLIAKYLMMV